MKGFNCVNSQDHNPELQLEGVKMEDDLLKKVVQEISENHRKIIEDWCKAYLAQMYQEGHDIKPGCFTLCLAGPNFDKDTNCIITKYWFEPGIPNFEEDNERL